MTNLQCHLSIGSRVLLRNRVKGRNKIQDAWNPTSYIVVSRIAENNTYCLKIPQMGKVKVVNRVDMLSFAITSEEEDTEKLMQIVTVIQAVRMNWLNLKFVQPENFHDIEPSRRNQPANTHHKMLENTGAHITYLNLLFKKMHHATTLYTLLCALLHFT